MFNKNSSHFRDELRNDLDTIFESFEDYDCTEEPLQKKDYYESVVDLPCRSCLYFLTAKCAFCESGYADGVDAEQIMDTYKKWCAGKEIDVAPFWVIA